MFKNFFFTIFLSLIFVSFLEASNEKINQQLFELKTSQDYAQKINDEKITLIMGQIIQKENEIKELEKELKEYVNKEDLQREINYQNNRIEDINSSVDRLSIIVSISIGLFGILITGIVIFFAFRFERIARVQADKEVKSWIDEKADEEFKPKVDSYLAQIDGRAKKLFEKNEGLTQELEDKLKLLDKYTEEEKKEIKEEVEEIKSSKNESDYTFEDKYKLFVSKYVNENYKEALEDLNILEKEDLNDNNLLKVLWAKAITLGQMGEIEEEKKVYDEVIKRFEDSKDNSILEKVASALVNKGVRLGQMRKNEEAIKVYDKVIKRFEDSKDNSILEKLASALVNKGAILGQMGKSKEATKVYDKVIKRFEDSKDNGILEKLASALYNKGATLGQMGENEEAIKVYDEVIKRFEDSKDNSILEKVASALYNKGAILGQIKVYDEVVKRFEDSEDNSILEQVAKALVNKGVKLGQMGENEEEIKVYDEVVKRFEDSKDNSILEKVASALVNKGVRLGQMGKNKEAIKVYDKVVKKFEDLEDNSILEQVASVLIDKGVRLGLMGENEEAIKVYDEVIKRFEDSKDNSILEKVASALVNKIESNLILNEKNTQKDLDLYFELVKDNRTELIKYQMLILLEKAKDIEIDEEIISWKDEFKDTLIKNWSFQELKTWANSFEDKVVKERLLIYIDIFEKHNESVEEKQSNI